MNTLRSFCLFLLLLPLALKAERTNWDRAWRFALADSASMARSDYDDSRWRLLDLPHDWAIEGDFSAANPSGAGGGALPGGTAWYRKHLYVDRLDKAADRYYIHFDGVYMNSTVYVNGHALGTRPYGYSSFRYDLTPHLKEGDNVVAVRVDNSDQPNSRWYSGCGIYRHVWLERKEAVGIAHWGIFVNPLLQKDGRALFTVLAYVGNETDRPADVRLQHTLLAPDGHLLATAKQNIRLKPRQTDVQNVQSLKLSQPEVWDIDRPTLYRVRTDLIVDGRTVDSQTTVTGVRDFRFDPATGFWLNGRHVKINGVCQHHDLGCLGAALNEDALHRQLKTLKLMGCNAIRCSHNPPAPELLDMCDSMGFIVMDEAFDMWRKRKTQNDYARFFDKWYERDLTDLIRRDRNHPSILMWSIGNEVLEQWTQADADTMSIEQANLLLNFGHDASSLAKEGKRSVNSALTSHLAETVKLLDPTRPVTAGCNEPDPNNHLFKSGSLDIIGFNYHDQYIADVPKNFPGKPFLMTESVSALQTRGYYVMPADSTIIAPREWWIPYTDPTYMCSAYDNCHASWGASHEHNWDVVKHTPWCAGQFVWTGWDYLGEPTPYSYPARSSYFGIVDLAGFPKDVYYMYQSEWTDSTVLHLFPHWNWLPGQTVDLWCYFSNADEVELFVNGRSQGIRRKADSHQYHVSWSVPFEAGEVKAVSRRNGQTVAEQTVHTAGAPHHLRLTPDRTQLLPDGRSTAFVCVEVVDKDGSLCPRADDEVFFSVKGAGRIIGVDNGSPISTERFKADHRKAFFGRCLVVVQNDGTSGPLTLTARGYALPETSVSFHTEQQ